MFADNRHSVRRSSAANTPIIATIAPSRGHRVAWFGCLTLSGPCRRDAHPTPVIWNRAVVPGRLTRLTGGC
jgi:hypothetical protein